MKMPTDWIHKLEVIDKSLGIVQKYSKWLISLSAGILIMGNGIQLATIIELVDDAYGSQYALKVVSEEFSKIKDGGCND